MTPTPIQPDRSPLLDPEPLAATLAALVRIDSVNPSYGGPEGGERRVLEAVAAWLGERGIDARLSGADPARPHLRARIPGRAGGPPILFQTHVDTVSVAGMRIAPFAAEIRDGRLWGRGATDAKGQAVAMLHAFAAWAAAPAPPPCPLELALVPDEEYCFGGARALLAEGVEARAIVVGEPTGLRVVTAHKGAVRLDVHVSGRLAHASTPERGLNAISAAAVLIQLIDERLIPSYARHPHPLLGPATINVARIEGGSQPNLVPDACRIHLERRLLPGETAGDVFSEIEALFPEAAARFPGFRAGLQGPSLEVSAFQTDPHAPLAAAAGRAAAALGLPPEPIGVAYCTDACELHKLDVPLIVAGPGSIAQAHTEDEWIDLEELARGAQFHTHLMGWDGNPA